MTSLAPRSIAIYIGDTYTSPDLAWFPEQPNAPSLDPSSDTGRSGTDNWTANNNPTIILSSPNQGYSGAHGVAIYVDGENFYETILGSEGPLVPNYSLTFTFSGLDLTDGVHSIQWQEIVENGKSGGGDAYGPISDPLWVLIDSAETGEPSTDVFGTSGISYGRYGQVETIGGVKFLTAIGACQVPMTQHLSDRVAGYITATALATMAFNAGTNTSVTLDTVVITNPTDAADPTAPTSVSLVGTSYSGADNDKLKLRYDDGTWELRGVTNV
jgi:hypothetical protein